MTIFIDEYIQKGYCKWVNGKIVVDKSCPEEIRQELKFMDKLWLEQQIMPSGHLVVFPKD